MHLVEIHKAPKDAWPILAQKMSDAKWSVKDIEHWTGKVRDIAAESFKSVHEMCLAHVRMGKYTMGGMERWGSG